MTFPVEKGAYLINLWRKKDVIGEFDPTLAVVDDMNLWWKKKNKRRWYRGEKDMST